MATIIGIHSIETIWPALGWTRHPMFEFLLLQPLKFGTVGFFLIAGFLFGERVHRYRPHVYFARRIRTVFVPWTFWLAFFCGIYLVHGIAARRIAIDASSLFSFGRSILAYSLFSTAYWFVPNLLVALAILLMFRRFLMDWRTGCIFFGASLFYAVNVYGHWVHAEHTRAVFGFVFYLWLGAWASWHFKPLKTWVARIHPGVMGCALFLSGMAALGEIRLLEKLHSVDPVNSLRMTNQIFSVVACLALLKAGRPLWPRLIDVRAHTFGLYLTHMPLLAVLGAVAARILRHGNTSALVSSVPGKILVLLLTFVLVYGGSLMTVRLLLSLPLLRWTVGVSHRAEAGPRLPRRATPGNASLTPAAHSPNLCNPRDLQPAGK